MKELFILMLMVDTGNVVPGRPINSGTEIVYEISGNYKLEDRTNVSVLTVPTDGKRFDDSLTCQKAAAAINNKVRASRSPIFTVKKEVVAGAWCTVQIPPKKGK